MTARPIFYGAQLALAPVSLAEADILRGVQIYPWGEVKHPKGDFTVDAGFAAEMLAAFEAFTADGYLPPVLVEHTADGKTYGVIHALHVRQGEGIFADLELAEGVRQEIDQGLRRYVSPSHYPEFPHPSTGEVWRTVLREVSLVSVPHLKNLQPLGDHYTMSEAGYLTPTQEATMAEDKGTAEPVANEEEKSEGEDTLAQMAAKIAALEKQLGEYKPMMEHVKKMMESEGDGGDEPEATDNSEQRIAALERELAISKASHTVRGRLPSATDEQVEALAGLLVASAEQAEVAISMAEVATRKTGTQTPIGTQGAATKPGPASLDEALEMAAKEIGSTLLSSTMPVVQKRWPHLTGELG